MQWLVSDPLFAIKRKNSGRGGRGKVEEEEEEKRRRKRGKRGRSRERGGEGKRRIPQIYFGFSSSTSNRITFFPSS